MAEGLPPARAHAVADLVEAGLGVLRAEDAGILACDGITSVGTPRLLRGRYLQVDLITDELPGQTQTVTRDLLACFHGMTGASAHQIAEVAVTEILNYRDLPPRPSRDGGRARGDLAPPDLR